MSPHFFTRKTPSMIFSRALVQLKYVQLIQRDLDKIETKKKNLKCHFLNQTYIVHLIALWQAFIEDLLRESSARMRISEGNQQVRTLLEHTCDKALSRFNTPNKKNIDQLFLDGIGVSNVTNAWSSAGNSPGEANEVLAYLLSARHSIAHTAKTEVQLSYDDNFSRMEVLFKMSELLEERVLGRIVTQQVGDSN